MKTSISAFLILILILIVGLMFSIETNARFDSKRPCKDATEEWWDNNFLGCMIPIQKGIDMGELDKEMGPKFCECAADELVNRLSCQDMKKVSGDEKTGQEIQDRIKKNCEAKFPLKKKKK